MPADTETSRAGRAGDDFPAAFYAVIRVIDGFSNLTGRLISLAMLLARRP